jgi:thiazole tautomerase (transcriptional regulator TenI)
MAACELHLVSGGGTPIARFVEMVSRIHPEVDYIHLREKDLSAAALFAAATRLLAAGVPAGKLTINDRIDVALAVGAGGVQLAGHSLPPELAAVIAPRLRLGRSVHSQQEATAAAREGAHYALYGHVYPSASKPGLPARGLAALAETIRVSAIPVVAIGGITPDNAAEVLRQGAGGIAVLSGITQADDPLRAVAAYRAAICKVRQERGCEAP